LDSNPALVTVMSHVPVLSSITVAVNVVADWTLIALPLYVVHTPFGASSRTVSPLAKRSPVTVIVCAVPRAVGVFGDSETMRGAFGLLGLGLLGDVGLSSPHAVVSPSPTTSALAANNFFRESNILTHSSPQAEAVLDEEECKMPTK
jgi:hypothetical protein